MNALFAIPLSDIGLNPLINCVAVSFGILFLISFVISSKNLDSAGIMDWMMKKPKDWIGYKNNNDL